ncbi:unnamed protein product [Rhizoctonia solani]|uniref:Zn(2)-C6 fungal-type domain-containing protein n=1 Tax=Rhizoctonia solani TaxID=456999 RepID=A0A8H2XUV6_9AGAM|nr:unnamed protein product [Rhizoctonia solani]
MAKSAPKPCTACAARALTNPSGKAKCNGKSPCTWCKNRKISCSYEESEHSTPPSTVPTKTPESTTSHRETTMTLTDKLDGSRTVRFSPDPENLGEVDATDASDFCLPGEPPIESYLILVGERKRKHADSLTRHDFETAPLSTAKRIRGGVEGDFDGDDNAPGPRQEAPNPLPVQPIDPMAQALQAIAMANTTMAASNATTHQMLAQMMERMGDNLSRRDNRPYSANRHESSRINPFEGFFDRKPNQYL